MSDDLLLKVLAPAMSVTIPLLFQLPAVTKILSELRHLRRDRLQREAEFTAKFAEQTNDDDLRSYAHELGIEALVPDGRLTTDERRVLLSKKDRKRLIEMYLPVRNWVRVNVAEQSFEWSRAWLARKLYRRPLFAALLGGYFSFAMLAATPWIFRDFLMAKLSMTPFLLVSAWAAIVCVPIAIACMKGSFSISSAAQFLSKFSDADNSTGSPPRVVQLRDQAQSRKDRKLKRG